MESVTTLRFRFPWNPSHRLSPSSFPFPRFLRAFSSSASQEGSCRGLKLNKNLVADFVSRNDEAVRGLPIYVGGASLLAVLFNRAVSGIAAVADASSSQSRADLLTLGVAVTNILTGLVWLSIRPKSITPVDPKGVECEVVNPDLPATVVSEFMWAWDSLSAATCCRSLIIVYNGTCMLQIGMAAESPEDGGAATVDTAKLMQGSVYQGVVKSGARTKMSENYLANLSLYPGRSELAFLPSNTQAVILQPLGDDGLAVVGGNTVRGFTSLDQAWISFIGEKLEATMGKYISNSLEISRDRV